MTDQTKTNTLWTPRSPQDTLKVYADWADTYEQDVSALSYQTPDRVAQALIYCGADLTEAVLDFGCGTGLSGLALMKVGFQTVDGMDISSEMLAQAKTKLHGDQPVYRKTTLAPTDAVPNPSDTYTIIVATGVISLGAAPPEMLATLLSLLPTGGMLAFSYNDPTLEDTNYINALETVLNAKVAVVLFREHGPHLSEKVTGSDVIVLRRV